MRNFKYGNVKYRIRAMNDLLIIFKLDIRPVFEGRVFFNLAKGSIGHAPII